MRNVTHSHRRAHGARPKMPPPPAARARSGTHPQLNALEADHRNFEKLLGVFEAELAQFHDAAAPDYGIMRDVMHYVTNYPDRAHHPTEELIFERLLRADPGARGAIVELQEQHRWLTAAGTRLLRLLDEVVADVLIPRASVESLARSYVRRLRAHMDQEESVLFPQAAACLAPEDWKAVTAGARDLPDPLFGDAPADREYRAIRERLA